MAQVTKRARLASSNPDKLAELRAALPDWELEALEADEYPEETGETFAANARLKAEFGRGVAPPEVWVLGEDSGIEVAALEGGPGVRTARWAAGEPVRRMLEALDGEPDRRARYVSELVALGPNGEDLTARGVLDGTIATEASGSAGFGFDPIFVPLGETRTVASLGNDWKREHSHRARAAAQLRAVLG